MTVAVLLFALPVLASGDWRQTFWPGTYLTKPQYVALPCANIGTWYIIPFQYKIYASKVLTAAE
jgi:hypothetical protein